MHGQPAIGGISEVHKIELHSGLGFEVWGLGFREYARLGNSKSNSNGNSNSSRNNETGSSK